MKKYLKFLGIGLILGLFLEVELKLIAESKPQGLVIAFVAYPILVTLFYWLSRIIDLAVASTWRGDVLHYLVVGFVGLIFEWVLLGNGLSSNAFQLGMFAMWTSWGFGPRILTRGAVSFRRFWYAFSIGAMLVTVTVLLLSNPKAKIVISVLGLSGTYIVWSIWLLILGWQHHQTIKNNLVEITDPEDE